MGQDVLPASHCQFHIQRQAVQILKDLLPYRLLYVFQVIVCDLTAISVPQGLLAAIVILRPILVLRRGGSRVRPASSVRGFQEASWRLALP